LHTESKEQQEVTAPSDELAALVREHASTILSQERYDRLLALLEEHVGFTGLVPGLACPGCGRPIVFTWNWGASACLHMYGGCGAEIGRPFNRSRVNLPWESYLSKRYKPG
jgi:hypothetical protein